MFSPFLPALPVLPVLWTKLSMCLHSIWMTTSISLISIPLAATSVATSTWLEPLSLNFLSLVSLLACSKSPWRVKKLAYVKVSNFLQSYLVSVKMRIFLSLLAEMYCLTKSNFCLGES